LLFVIAAGPRRKVGDVTVPLSELLSASPSFLFSIAGSWDSITLLSTIDSAQSLSATRDARLGLDFYGSGMLFDDDVMADGKTKSGGRRYTDAERGNGYYSP
jgi:hypothetical protein